MWYNFRFNRAIKCFFTFRIDYKCGCLSFGTIWIPRCGSGIRSFGWIIIWILISVLATSPFCEINNSYKEHHHTNYYQSNVPCIWLRLKIFQIIQKDPLKTPKRPLYLFGHAKFIRFTEPPITIFCFVGIELTFIVDKIGIYVNRFGIDRITLISNTIFISFWDAFDFRSLPVRKWADFIEDILNIITTTQKMVTEIICLNWIITDTNKWSCKQIIIFGIGLLKLRIWNESLITIVTNLTRP